MSDSPGPAGKTESVKPNAVVEAFNKHGVVPDVIQTSPEQLLNVKFDPEEVKLGTELTPTQAHNSPLVSWKVDPDKFYLLTCVDADPPSRSMPLLREINHWMIGNIPGDDIAKGDLLVSYIPPGPPPGSGLHRYIFLVYEQPDKLKFAELPNGRLSRMRFKINTFAEKHKLGEPVAGNFFQSRWDREKSNCTIT